MQVMARFLLADDLPNQPARDRRKSKAHVSVACGQYEVGQALACTDYRDAIRSARS